MTTTAGCGPPPSPVSRSSTTPCPSDVGPRSPTTPPPWRPGSATPPARWRRWRRAATSCPDRTTSTTASSPPRAWSSSLNDSAIPVILLVARRHRLLALLEHGEIGRVDDEIAAYARTSEHLRLPLYSWIVPVWRGMRALMDGDLHARLGAVRRRRGTRPNRRQRQRRRPRLLAALRHRPRLRLHRGARRTTSSGSSATTRATPRPTACAPSTSCSRAASDAGPAGAAARMSAGIESIPRDSEWLETLWNLGDVAVAAGDLEAVEAVHDALVPYAHLWVSRRRRRRVLRRPSPISSVALSIALDRRDEAQQWLDAAEHAHESAGADHLAASTAALLHSVEPVPPGHAAAAPRQHRRARRDDGPIWHLRWQGVAVTVRHSKGVLDIARLLEQPGQEFHALDLMDATGSSTRAGGVGTGPRRQGQARLQAPPRRARGRPRRGSGHGRRGAHRPARARTRTPRLRALPRLRARRTRPHRRRSSRARPQGGRHAHRHRDPGHRRVPSPTSAGTSTAASSPAGTAATSRRPTRSGVSAYDQHPSPPHARIAASAPTRAHTALLLPGDAGRSAPGCGPSPPSTRPRILQP